MECFISVPSSTLYHSPAGPPKAQSRRAGGWDAAEHLGTMHRPWVQTALWSCPVPMNFWPGTVRTLNTKLNSGVKLWWKTGVRESKVKILT